MLVFRDVFSAKQYASRTIFTEQWNYVPIRVSALNHTHKDVFSQITWAGEIFLTVTPAIVEVSSLNDTVVRILIINFETTIHYYTSGQMHNLKKYSSISKR